MKHKKDTLSTNERNDPQGQIGTEWEEMIEWDAGRRGGR